MDMSPPRFQLKGQFEFDWDEGNRDKNELKHNVSTKECEEVFGNKPVVVISDEKHSLNEQRWGILGVTNQGRKLAIAFTLRREKIRVVTARNQNRKERRLYEQDQANS